MKNEKLRTRRDFNTFDKYITYLSTLTDEQKKRHPAYKTPKELNINNVKSSAWVNEHWSLKEPIGTTKSQQYFEDKVVYKNNFIDNYSIDGKSFVEWMIDNDSISKRERKIIKMILHNISQKDVAKELECSTRTIRRDIKSIRQKLLSFLQ